MGKMSYIDFYKQFKNYHIISPLWPEEYSPPPKDTNTILPGVASLETYELSQKLWSREIDSWEEVFEVIGDRVSSLEFMTNLHSDLYVHPENEDNATFFYKAVYDFVEEVLFGVDVEKEDWSL